MIFKLTQLTGLFHTIKQCFNCHTGRTIYNQSLCACDGIVLPEIDHSLFKTFTAQFGSSNQHSTCSDLGHSVQLQSGSLPPYFLPFIFLPPTVTRFLPILCDFLPSRRR